MSKSTHGLGGAVLSCMLALGLQSSLMAQGGFEGPGRYEITNIRSGKVVDLDRNDQTTVIQFSSRGTDNQTWDVQRANSGYYYLRNGMNGYALEASSDRNSAPLRGVPFNGSPAQEWRIEPGKDGNAVIVNRNGKVIDVPDGTRNDGAHLQVYGTTGDSNQRFTFRRVSGGIGRDYGDRRNARNDYDRGRYDQGQDARGRDYNRDRSGYQNQPDQSGRYYDDRDRMFKMNGDGVCFYRETNYRGEAFCARAGESIRQMGPQWNNTFSSVKFFGRTRSAEIYQDPNFSGDHVRIRNDEPDLSRIRANRNDSFNDRVTSFRVE